MNIQAHLNDNMHIKFFCVESYAFIESSSLAIIEIHRHVDLQIMFCEVERKIQLLGTGEQSFYK